MLTILIATARAAVCPADSAADIGPLAAEVEAAFDAVDDQAFERAVGALAAAVPCVRSPLDGATIEGWHRARALAAFYDRELVASGKSWASVRELSPGYSPPASWMPPDSALARVWKEAPAVGDRVQLERVPEGGWVVDGERTLAVPSGRAFILQGFDAGGHVVHLGYHYSVAEVPVVDFAALDPTAQDLRRRRMRAGGTALSIGLLSGAGMALGLASTARTDALGGRTDFVDIEDHAARADRLSNTAVALAAGGGVVLVTSWAVRW